MKTLLTALALSLLSASAFAVPPTVSPSPGYDRALAESRRAREAAPPPVVAEPAPAPVKPKISKKRKR